MECQENAILRVEAGERPASCRRSNSRSIESLGPGASRSSSNTCPRRLTNRIAERITIVRNQAANSSRIAEAFERLPAREERVLDGVRGVGFMPGDQPRGAQGDAEMRLDEAVESHPVTAQRRARPALPKPDGPLPALDPPRCR
jgi:hypothetical protein